MMYGSFDSCPPDLETIDLGFCVVVDENNSTPCGGLELSWAVVLTLMGVAVAVVQLKRLRAVN